MLHAGSSIPGFALSNPFQQHLSPSLFSDLIAWYQRTTVVAFWPEREQLHLNFGSLFPPNSWKEKTLPLDFGPFPLLGPWAWCPPWPRVTKWQILSVTGRIINTPPSCSDSPSQPRKALSPCGQGRKMLQKKMWNSGELKIQNVPFQHCGVRILHILSEEWRCLLYHC